MSDEGSIDPLKATVQPSVFNKIRSMTLDLRDVERRERDLISGRFTVAEPYSAPSK
jgi:hypothetical protein